MKNDKKVAKTAEKSPKNQEMATKKAEINKKVAKTAERSRENQEMATKKAKNDKKVAKTASIKKDTFNTLCRMTR